MPDPNSARPKCLACGVTFDDEDVRNGNYAPVSFDLESGPTFIHKTCVRFSEDNFPVESDD